MSSYADLATSIINKNGQGGKFSGLNTALDLRQQFVDAQRQFQFQQQLAKEQGYNAGVAGIINSSTLYGTNPTEAISQYRQVVDAGPNGTLPNLSIAGAGNLASGAVNNPAISNPIVPSVPAPSSNVGTSSSNETPSSLADPSGFNEQQALKDGLNPQRIALLKQYAVADPNTGQYKRDASTLNQRSPAQIAISQQLAKYAPGLNTQIASQQKNFINDTWNKGEISKIRFATENLTQHLGMYSKYQQALQNGDIQAANSIMNQYKQQTGNSDITNAATFARAAGVETAKVLSQNGVLSNEQYNDAMKNLPTNASQSQSQNSIHDMMQVLEPRINSVVERYKENFGVYPPQAFTPEAINAIKGTAPDVYNSLAPKLRANGVTQSPIAQGIVNAGNQITGQNSSQNSDGFITTPSGNKFKRL